MIAVLGLAAQLLGYEPPCTQVEAAWTPMDSENHMQAVVALPQYMPWRDVTSTRTANYCVPINPGAGKIRITRVRTFFATDRGNVCEADIKVVVDNNQLAVRSEHKEGAGIYDAWKETAANRLITYPTLVELQVSAWPTTPNGSVAVHFGMLLDLDWIPPVGTVQ